MKDLKLAVMLANVAEVQLSRELRLTSTQLLLFRHLKQNWDMSGKEAAHLLGVSENYGTTLLQQLKAKGYAEYTTEGGPGVAHRYQVSHVLQGAINEHVLDSVASYAKS